MNYSVLLPRSVDFDEFSALLYPSYPDEEARPLVFDMMQLLWDRGEPDGYAERMTSNPLPGHAGPPGAAGRRLRRPPGERLPGGGRGAHDRRERAPAGPVQGPLAAHEPAVGRADDHALPVHGLGDLRAGTAARSAKAPRARANSSAPNRRRTKTCPTAPAKTRTACRGRRPPSSSSCRTSSKERSRRPTAATRVPATRGASPGRRKSRA